MTPQETKQAAAARLQSMVTPEWLGEVDARLPLYIEDVRWNNAGDNDVHNIDEILACCKFLRMCNSYKFNKKHVQRFVKLYENFEFSGLEGRTKYKMTPIQVFLTAGIFGFLKDDGRRVVREAIAFIPRKFAKTTYGAALALDDFLFGDANGEVHIVANAEAQAKICYKEAKALAMQLDPEGKHIRFTANSYNWKEGEQKSSSVTAHTAGGKNKDGAFASLVIADEYGSATYVKDHSDMADALNVFESSMGPRKNPLTVITTTAGKVTMGPFEQKLKGGQHSLKDELKTAHCSRTSNDWQFILALHPDEWEYTDEHFAQPRIHKKVNPHIGITVQPDYYVQQWHKAQGDPEVYKETVTKLFNQFVSASSRPWIQPDDIRKLQSNELTIDNISSDDGWVCFVGCDFSKGDDLNAQSYLCVREKESGGYEFFADMDAWIAEEQVAKNSNGTLYNIWIEQGWLHTSPGKTIDENLSLSRLQEISEHLTILRIGYDSYDSKRFINAFGAWIYSMGGEPKDFLKSVSQNFATYNSLVQELDYLVHVEPPLIQFSGNPMWAWEFGNCVLQESNDGMSNVKPVKRTVNAKVDNVQCLLSALKLFDDVEATEM